MKEEIALSRRRLVALAPFAALGLASSRSAAAQDEQEAPLERPIVIYPLKDARVTALVQGEFGPLRLSGTLTEAPKDPVRVADSAGRTREVAWTEVRTLQQAPYPAEGIPAGSFLVTLTSDPVEAVASTGGFYSTGTGGGNTSAVWRMSRLPEGQLKLSGKPFGELTLPVGRLLSFNIDPIRGNTTEMPAGSVRLEILPGVVIAAPLADMRAFRRDVARGTVAVVMEDDQSLVGKLVELPNAAIALKGAGATTSLPLAGIAQFDRAVPGARRL
jgi:hypothetical protein